MEQTSQVFYRRWRPQTLAEVVGQEAVTRTLLNALAGGRVSHAYLFCGPRGTGKTSTGRILAKAVNCLNGGRGEPCNTCDMCRAITEGRALDVIEIDAASNTGVDDIRSLREKVNYAPNQAQRKVYIIDEVHMLSNSASNALLKTLEEPPPQVIFILATTEIHKVLPTILSRCQRFDFRRLSQADIVSKLSHICDVEGIQAEPEALRLVARSSRGSLRDAENLLEQMTAYYGPEVSLHQVQTVLGITGDWRAKELVKHIVDNDVAAGIATINSASGDGLDLRQFNREVVAHLRNLLLMKTGSGEAADLTPEDTAELKTLAGQASLSQVLRAVKLFGEVELGLDGYSTLPLELALVDCILAAEGEAGVPRPTTAEPPRPVAAAPAQPAAERPMKKAKPAVEKAEAAPVVDEAPPEKAGSAAVTEPVPEVTAPPPGGELEGLRLNWKRVVDDAPADVKRTNAVALLRSAGVKPVEMEGDTVVLAFKYSLHKENMEKPENQRVAERIVSNFLGRTCRVRCVYQSESNHLVEAAKKMGARVISVEEK
jgi:DNA polymerase-3 subunit gamma/tau